MKKLIVGLGNPGEQYSKTRHNIGFQTIDKVCEKLNVSLTTNKFEGIFFVSNDFILAKPMTYMNLSGNFIQQLTNFYKINSEDILIIYDDLDTPVGQAKIKTTGGAGGHNGLQNIIDKLGTKNINRIKIGIGRPKKSSNESISHYVLNNFDSDEREMIDLVIEKTANIIISSIDNGIKNIINEFNNPKKQIKE